MEQIKEYEYVDLGLPSGLRWAKCNIGAETETDYGDYFIWGSTTPNTKTECSWKSAPFNGGSSHYNETYFNSVKDTVCPNGILAKEYDAFYLRGSDGYYWSSSPHSSLSTHGLCLNFYSGGVNPQNLSSRFIGFCARSVSRNK